MSQLVGDLWPRGLLTLDDWNALPEQELLTLECVEGVLVVAAKPLPSHQRAGMRLGVALESQLEPILSVSPDIEVLLCESPLTIRDPDLVVHTRESAERDGAQTLAADVLVAIEIISPGSRRTDRVMKLSEYADAAIPRYWIIDLEGEATLTEFALEDGGYVLVAEHSGPVRLAVADTEVTFDLDIISRV